MLGLADIVKYLELEMEILELMLLHFSQDSILVVLLFVEQVTKVEELL